MLTAPGRNPELPCSAQERQSMKTYRQGSAVRILHHLDGTESHVLRVYLYGRDKSATSGSRFSRRKRQSQSMDKEDGGLNPK